jgi:hypothetical protein
MKNQYCGDINDYRKYGLLRSITRNGAVRILVAWMLTPDDNSSDGNFVSYLEHPEKWAHHDPELFHKLKSLLASGWQRQVQMIEQSGLLDNAVFFSPIVPDAAPARTQWFDSLRNEAESCELIFLDPDNGIEVKSKRYGTKNSSKYLYWREIEKLWSDGKSLLLYQHFIREKRSAFIQRMLEELKDMTTGSFVEAFSTPHVVFFMALQPDHQHLHAGIVNNVQRQWAGQIQHSELFSLKVAGV